MTDFKRDAYYMVKNAFQQSNVVFLLGPRKCGKTYALTQFCLLYTSDAADD